MKIESLFLLFTVLTFGQPQYPRDYFGSPLDIPLQLSGNFGELRPNHFHSGLDIKTKQMEGFEVYATADGYVSRIKISEIGYGKAIYITHPNGYTTVYGHLKSGFGEIEEYIKGQQYKLKSYEIDINLPPDVLVVKKCDAIAISGNTGGSDGPHLHFEIRDTQTEKVINPLHLGFDYWISDTQAPVINGLWVYPLDENSVANQSKRPVMLSLTKQEDSSYVAEKVMAAGRIGFGLNAFDFDDVSKNENGVFSLQTIVNGYPDFWCQFDAFSFDETRLVNALIDYGRYKKTGQRVLKLFMENPYPLSTVTTGKTNGILEVMPNVTQTFSLDLSDFNGNKASVFVPILYSSLPAEIVAEPKSSKYLVKAKRDNIFSKENVTVSFPANTFLDDFFLDFDVTKEILKLHEDMEPAFRNFSITFEDSLTSPIDREKMFIGLKDGNKVYFHETKKQKNSFTAYSKVLGEYHLLKDTIAPKISIKESVEGKEICELNELQFSISDDLSGIKSYEGLLNGNWMLLEFDRKTKKLIHRFSDGIVAEGRNDLKITVTDNVGNSAIFETHFFRSQEP